MRSLTEEFLRCLNQFEKTGLIPCGNISWSINSRARNWWFKVNKTPENNFAIQVNPHLLNSIVPQTALQSVLCTALIHTLPNCYRYGKTWQAVADMLNDNCGYWISKELTAEATVKPHKSAQTVVEKVPTERKLNLAHGDFVDHDTHGQGIVCQTTPMGKDVILTILFQRSGVVQLMQGACALSMRRTAPNSDRKASP